MADFFQTGADVEVRRADERGDSLPARVGGAKGGNVALQWRGDPPRRAPAAGALVRVIRKVGDHQMAVTAQVVKVDSAAMVVTPKGPPASYGQRTYLRVDAHLPLRFTVVPPGDVEKVASEIEKAKKGARHVPVASPVPPRTAVGLPGSRAHTTRPETAMASVPPELARRLDRIEGKLDEILVKLAGKDERRALREVCRVDISGSGMRFEASSSVADGSHLDIEVELGLAPPVIIRVLLKVLRATPVGAAQPARWSVSGQYVAVHEQDRGEIVRYSFERQRELRDADRGGPSQAKEA